MNGRSPRSTWTWLCCWNMVPATSYTCLPTASIHLCKLIIVPLVGCTSTQHPNTSLAPTLAPTLTLTLTLTPTLTQSLTLTLTLTQTRTYQRRKSFGDNLGNEVFDIIRLPIPSLDVRLRYHAAISATDWNATTPTPGIYSSTRPYPPPPLYPPNSRIVHLS